MGRTLPELGSDRRRAAAWLEDVAGRADTVATLLTGTHDCLTPLFGALRSGMTLVSLPHPARGVGAVGYLAQIGRMCAISGATHLFCKPVLVSLPSSADRRAALQNVRFVGLSRYA